MKDKEKIRGMVSLLEGNKERYGLEGVEITEEDAWLVEQRIKEDGMTEEDAVDDVLEGIRHCITEGW